MKTITLHLTFSAAVLEIRCSLPQLEEKRLSETSNTHKPEGEEGRRGRGAKGCQVRLFHPRRKDEKDPRKPDLSGGGTQPQGEKPHGG